jgi:hypothetical protein
VFIATPTHVGHEQYDVATRLAVSHHFWVIGRSAEHVLVAASLRLARRARPDGAARRLDPARTMGRLAP